MRDERQAGCIPLYPDVVVRASLDCFNQRAALASQSPSSNGSFQTHDQRGAAIIPQLDVTVLPVLLLNDDLGRCRLHMTPIGNPADTSEERARLYTDWCHRRELVLLLTVLLDLMAVAVRGET